MALSVGAQAREDNGPTESTDSNVDLIVKELGRDVARFMREIHNYAEACYWTGEYPGGWEDFRKDFARFFAYGSLPD